jgi:hypothetical protein
MRRYLIVANQTLTNPHLRNAVLARQMADDCEFHVIVPATRARGTLTWTEGQAVAHARGALEDVLAHFRSDGISAIGDVGDDNPVLAVRDALKQQHFDEIIISTLPPGASRWLKRDLPHRLAQHCALPVTHVTAPRMTAVH